MLLHAAKYPHCAVNGLLVAENKKRKDGQSVVCVDCVPLFHGTLALAPMMEIALTLLDTWCKENKYVIAGYYQANERIKEISASENIPKADDIRTLVKDTLDTRIAKLRLSADSFVSQ
ncbi:EMC8 protein, partial [Polyodon spathula]|nr:EMC8 protein [Polyodon spathula]